MTQSEINDLDKVLKNIGNLCSILVRKRGFYLYYNEPTKLNKEINIHTHTCGFCAWGSGRGRKGTEPGRNGVWIGPFNTVKQAEKFAKEILKPSSLTNHSCIK
jgi:hypothetical protein